MVAEASDSRHIRGAADILSTVRQVAEQIVGPQARETDAQAQWPEKSIRALQAAGLGGLVVPREHGGLGQGLLGLTQACEILGQECASTAISFGMHCVGSAVLSAQATDYQVSRFLGPISEGRHLTTLALSEPGTGSHFYFPQCQLQQTDEDQLTLSGTKCFVTNGGHADSYVVSTMHSGDHGLTQFSCVVVEDGLPGMTWGGGWEGFGMRGNDSRSLRFDDTPIPAGNLLGAVGDQTWYVFNVVAPYFLMAMSGSYLGVATSALEAARVHLTERQFSHSGRSLSEADVLQHSFATNWSKLEATRQLVYNAARSFDRGDEDAVVKVMVSKAEVAETATQVVNNAMTFMGGMAYRDGERIQRSLRDVRASHVMAPTTDLLRIWAGRLLLGLPLLGE